MWNCTHFRHPTDEQLGHVDIFFSNYYNLQSVYSEFTDSLCTDAPNYALKHTLPTLPTPRYGHQYLTRSHIHITPAVAAKDGCFVLVRTHQHGIASIIVVLQTPPHLKTKQKQEDFLERGGVCLQAINDLVTCQWLRPHLGTLPSYFQ